MSQPTANSRVIRFGLFEVDLESRELRKAGIRIKLHEQPFLILEMLLESPGEIVTREELKNKLWTKDTFVDFDLSLNSAVKKLRQALNDDSENPRFVETLYRRGYRFIGPVNGTIVNGTTSDASAQLEASAPRIPPPPSTDRGWFRRPSLMLYGAGILLLLLLAVAL